MIIAIDGPAGSGKSTLAAEIAKREHFVFLDTGAMYRCITYKVLQHQQASQQKLSDEQIVALAQDTKIELVDEAGTQKVFCDGLDVTQAIRTQDIDENVSGIAAIAKVREILVALQQSFAQEKDVVAEGRDTTTVVFPQADIKIFLEADLEIRAKRRAAEQLAQASTEEEKQHVLEAMKLRDKKDSERQCSPLVCPKDALVLNSTNLSLDEECSVVHKRIQEVRKAQQNIQKQAEKQVCPKLFQKDDDAFFMNPMRSFSRPCKALYKIVIAVVHGFSTLFWHPSFENEQEFLEYLSAHNNRCVLIMNHVSMIEPVAMVCFLAKHHIPVRPIYKEEFNHLGRIPQLLFRACGGLPVKRGTADMKLIRQATKALANGEVVLIYPEGTRIKGTTSIDKFHKGYELIAQLGKADIIPAAIVGAADRCAEGKKISKPGKVYIGFGKALRFSDIEAKSKKEKTEKMHKLAFDAVIHLRDTLRKKHPGKY